MLTSKTFESELEMNEFVVENYGKIIVNLIEIENLESENDEELIDDKKQKYKLYFKKIKE